MNNELPPPTVDERRHSAQRLVGYAMNWQPTELYTELGSPRTDTLAETVAAYITNEAHLYKVTEHLDIISQQYLSAAINDMQDIVDLCRLQQPRIREQEMLNVVTNPDTTLAIATLALRSEIPFRAMNVRYKNLLQNPSISSNDVPYAVELVRSTIVPSDNITPEATGGCPFAGKNQIVAPAPIFNRFVAWAGELSVRSIYNSQNNKKDPA